MVVASLFGFFAVIIAAKHKKDEANRHNAQINQNECRYIGQ